MPKLVAGRRKRGARAQRRKNQVPNKDIGNLRDWRYRDTSPPLRLAAIYRPPPSKRNQSTFELFLSEFGDYLEDIIMKPGRLIITGDFNLHVDNDANRNAAEFMSCLESSDLLQHVRSSTHRSGHILDLVISRKRDCIDPRVIVSEGVSDHHTLNWSLPIAKKRLTSRVVNYRRTKFISPDKFTTDIISTLTGSLTDTIVDQLLDLYYDTLRSVLDMHAPVKTRSVPIRSDPEWYSINIRNAKQKRR
ncbi:hypothetical protein CAPTEDRAFT_217120 [Capitella teleta]|uniref:Endonuclease/exonuclease/phosphatase domain-containing protein n=1 Tax=Capitella teleta TaxID=283909 RepID=R7VE36_CAPTE|nr:hypothetical protein CAPTEDRAFT_217120 [Capitella teleta]|eukprot:ELU17098.1 hypothetical protein CAPTEDRAFT_217120 [Capitella teleta]